MRALIISLTIIVGSLFAFTPAASAVNGFGACASGTATTTEACKSVNSQAGKSTDPVLVIMKTVINLLSYIIGIVAVIVLIIAGIQMVIGGSDPQAVANARNTMIYALVGVAVAVLSQAIVVFVLKHVS